MLKYVIISIISGIGFGILDLIINSLPIARKMHEYYQPVSRQKVDVLGGILINVFFGFAMAGLFILLSGCLPGGPGWVKGLSFAVMIWFIRVVMRAFSSRVTETVPGGSLVYMLASGLVEMVLIGLLYGWTLSDVSIS